MKFYNNNYSIAAVDWFKILDGMCELEFIKNHLQIKLNDAKVRFPEKDYSEQENIINLLIKNLDLINETEKNNRYLCKEVFKINNICSDIESKLTAKDLEIENLKKELEDLKINLTPTF